MDRAGGDGERAELRPQRRVHSGLLGTVIEVRVALDAHVDDRHDDEVVDTIDVAVVAEIERLASIFSVYDDASELSRWRRGETTTVSTELGEVLGLAVDWQTRSGGAFAPLGGALWQRWRGAERDGVLPERAEMASLAQAARREWLDRSDPARPRPIGDVTGLDLNAIAKGYIVDRALDAASAAANELGVVVDVTVSAGGDLCHRGARPTRIGIENPLRPYDNEPPLAVIDLDAAAVATSGTARRGVRIGGVWLGHVIDPRTGWPADGAAAASVVADDAASADAAATVPVVLGLDAGLAWVDSLGDRFAAVAVDADGRIGASARWIDRFGPLSATSARRRLR